MTTSKHCGVDRYRTLIIPLELVTEISATGIADRPKQGTNKPVKKETIDKVGALVADGIIIIEMSHFTAPPRLQLA